ncbi:hypothetical protein ABZ851_32985 [Streptomyces sp. NPDC047049]|uniref:hypothetical protein n=1 Tax=Streptomyces sp. NPDC047049 TaxID=3156688 RepID=UPI0033F1ABE0
MFLIIRRPQLRQQLRRLYRSMHELHDRSVAEKRRADTAAQELEQLQLAVNIFRRQSIEIQATISRLDIRESAEAWALGAHIIALLDGPVPPGPPPRFCPSCQIADVEDYDLPIPHTDDSAPCARCRRCGHNWALDPAADGCCVACGGSGNLGRQGLDDPPCPCMTPEQDHLRRIRSGGNDHAGIGRAIPLS